MRRKESIMNDEDEVVHLDVVAPNSEEEEEEEVEEEGEDDEEEEVEEEEEEDEDDMKVFDEENSLKEATISPQKKRGRPKKSPAKEVRDEEPKKAPGKKVDDVVEFAAKVKARFEKLVSRNNKETNRTVTRGLQHSDINVITYFEQKLADPEVVPMDLYESPEKTAGLEFFEEKCARNIVIRDGLNGMVQNCIAVVDLICICKRNLFSENKDIGITLQIQMVMSKLKLSCIIVLSSCLLQYCLNIVFWQRILLC